MEAATTSKTSKGTTSSRPNICKQSVQMSSTVQPKSDVQEPGQLRSNSTPSMLPERQQSHENATTIVALTVQFHQQTAELGPNKAKHQCGLAASRAVLPWLLLCARPDWTTCWWLIDPGRLAGHCLAADSAQHESCKEAHHCKKQATAFSRGLWRKGMCG